MRAIVQISVAGVDNTMSTQSSAWIVALCDDGTAWYITDSNLSDKDFPGWRKLPDIPQYSEQPEAKG